MEVICIRILSVIWVMRTEIKPFLKNVVLSSYK
jgi:hypothetical protein